MKYVKPQSNVFYLLLLCVLAAGGVHTIAADANLNMVFTTTNAGGSYGNKHVHVVWIEDSSGNFVYTSGSTTTDNKRAVWANSRASSLKEWWNGNAANRSADVAARTGATQTAYKTYNLNWNWRKKDGSILPDGNYQVHFLCTNADSGTPNNKAVFNITKGPSPQTVGPVNQGGYNNVKLTFTPAGLGVVTMVPTNVTFNSATLNGQITSTGGNNPNVYFYWGDNDGGTNPINWDHSIDLGVKGAGDFSTDISGLTQGTTYYYTCRAVNSSDTWASETQSFTANSIAVIFAQGDTWKYFKGTSFPGANWNNTGFNDTTWLSGPSGIGYDDGDDATVLSDMRDNYMTVYMRKSIHIDNPADISNMTFTVDYDDGFVAFINGVEVARRGVDSGQNQNTPATSHSAFVDGGEIEDIDITEYKSAMTSGENIFAIEVHNQSLSSSDLTMIPEMTIVGGIDEPAVRIGITPAILDFGEIAVGSHIDLTFDILNIGNSDDLVVNSLEITGLSKSAYSIISAPAVPFDLPLSSGTITVTVRFEPQAYTEYKYASVSVGSSDGDSRVANLPLTGTGIRDTEVLLSALSGVGGVCNAVAGYGSNLFVGQGAMLTILEASNPSTLQLIGQVRLAGIIEDITVIGNTAFAAVGASGIQAVDITTLSAPVALPALDTPGHAFEVDSHGNTLCVADGPGGFLIYDISTPGTPILTNTYPAYASVTAVTISGAKAFVLDDRSGLRIVDLTSQLSLKAHWKLDDSALDSTNSHNGTIYGNPTFSGGQINRAIAFDGDDYITANTVSADIANGDFTLTAWIKSNSTAKQEFFAAFNDAASGNKLLIGHNASTSNLLVHDKSYHDSGTVVFDGNWHHIAIALNDAADTMTIYVDGDNVHSYSTETNIEPTDLFSLGQEYDPDLVTGDFYNGLLDDVRIYPHALNASDIRSLYYAWDELELTQALVVSGTTAYIADQLGGFFVVDLADPAATSILGQTQLAGIGTSIAVSGSYAYVTNASGVEVIDIKLPAQPDSIGFLKMDGQSHDIVVSGQNAFLAAGTAGLITLDLTDASSPAVAGAFTQQANSIDVAAVGSQTEILSADSESGLGVFAFLDNMAPQAISRMSAILEGDLDSDQRVDMADYAVLSQAWLAGYSVDDISVMAANWLSAEGVGTARSIVVSNELAYVASGLDGLKILDISSPSTPRVIGRFATEGFAQAVAVSGGKVLVADGRRVYVINASTPEAPALTATYHSDGWASGIAIDNSYGYVANGGKGLVIINLSDASQTGFMELPGVAYDVAVSGGAAYVAAGSAGLQIIDVSEPASPSVISSFDTPGIALGVTIVGSRVCVADKYSVAVIDVANSSEPSLYALSDVPVNALSTEVVSSRLIVADGKAGIAILRPHAWPTLPLGDLDGNNIVDFADLAILADNWLNKETMLDVLKGNLTDDTTVNLEDYSIMSGNWSEDYNP